MARIKPIEVEVNIVTTTASSSSMSATTGGYINYGNFYDDGTIPYYTPNYTPIEWNQHSSYPPIYPPVTIDTDLEDIKKELKKLKKKLQNKEIPMKNLFNVVVVSIDEEMLLDVKVVAGDREEASFNAGVHSVIIEAKLKPKDVTVLIRDLGQIKIRPEQKRVIVEKE